MATPNTDSPRFVRRANSFDYRTQQLEDNYKDDSAEYGHIAVTTDQYKYIADRLCTILGDSDIQKYRMLLVEFGEKEVASMLGFAQIYYGEPFLESFWQVVDGQRSMNRQA